MHKLLAPAPWRALASFLNAAFAPVAAPPQRFQDDAPRAMSAHWILYAR
jgi:hypothetical protein